MTVKNNQELVSSCSQVEFNIYHNKLYKSNHTKVVFNYFTTYGVQSSSREKYVVIC